MGDPRRMKSKIDRPSHPWDKARIEEEAGLSAEYGLRNKKELWRMRNTLRGFTTQAKNLIASTSDQGALEKEQLLKKLFKLGLTDTEKAELDDVLALTITNLLERRLQTQIVRKGLAKSMKQARQFLVHKHIVIGDRTVSRPSYIVTREDEEGLQFVEKSVLSDGEHPARQGKAKEIPVEEAPAEEAAPSPAKEPVKEPAKPATEAPKKPEAAKPEVAKA